MSNPLVLVSELLPDKEVIVEIGETEYQVNFFDYDFIGTTEECPDCGASKVTDKIVDVHEIINQNEMTLVPLNSSLAKQILKRANEQLYEDHLHCPRCFDDPEAI